MKMNNTKMMMIMIIMITTLTVMSSNNMLLSWMSMEINMIVFMPIMTESKKMKDQPMKYFIVQSMSSSMMLMSVLTCSIIESPINESILMMTSMLMKLGMMPFHLWVPNIMQKMMWETCIMLTTLQKISPTIVISQMTKMNTMIMPMMISMLMSPLSAIKQLSFKKIMAYSSISNTPWMIISLKFSKSMFIMFFAIYAMITTVMMKKMKKMNTMYMNQMMNKSNFTKMSTLMTMLSMSGMPPMTGFFPKWMILQNMSKFSIMLSMMMVSSSIISTFIYLKMTNMMMISMSTTKKSMKKNKIDETEMILNTLGLPMSMIMKSS